MIEVLNLLKEWGFGADTVVLVLMVWKISKLLSRFEALEKRVQEHSLELWGNGKEGLKDRMTRLMAEHCVNHGDH